MSANPLHVDLNCSNNYQNGLNAAAKVSCPSQLILARQDKMTPVKGGLALRDALPTVQACDILEDVGHMLPMEAPDAVLKHLAAFIAKV